MAFGERLAQLRRDRGMTQEEFAAQLNVSRQAVSKWESCRGYPELEKILYICSRWDVTLDELFSDELPPADRAEVRPEPPERMASQPLKTALGEFVSNLSPANKWAGAGRPDRRDAADGAVYPISERRRRYGDDGAVDRGHHRLRRGGGPDLPGWCPSGSCPEPRRH